MLYTFLCSVVCVEKDFYAETKNTWPLSQSLNARPFSQLAEKRDPKPAGWLQWRMADR